MPDSTTLPSGHSHVFLGEGHDRSERRTWAVIALCGVMMIAEQLPANAQNHGSVACHNRGESGFTGRLPDSSSTRTAGCQ